MTGDYVMDIFIHFYILCSKIYIFHTCSFHCINPQHFINFQFQILKIYFSTLEQCICVLLSLTNKQQFRPFPKFFKFFLTHGEVEFPEKSSEVGFGYCAIGCLFQGLESLKTKWRFFTQRLTSGFIAWIIPACFRRNYGNSCQDPTKILQGIWRLSRKFRIPARNFRNPGFLP